MHTRIEKKRGHVYLAMDDQAVVPVALRSFRPNADVIGDFYQKGFQLFNVFPSGIMCALANRTIPYSQFGEVWSGEGSYRWDRLEAQIALFKKEAPRGYISVNIHLDPPDWYLKEHPECADSWDQLIQNVSYMPWRESAARYLCALIDKLDEWLPGRLYGIFLLAGGTTEWYTRNKAGFSHPLPIQQDAYRVWCQDKQAVIPGIQKLEHTTDGCFRHPETDRNALNYWRFVSESVTDCIQYFAAVAKKHTQGQKVVGVFTGYIHGMPLTHVVESSYNAFPRILNDTNIDCIFCPASYRFRKLCDTSAFRVPIDSFALHNKLYFHEIDSTTHLTHDHPIAKLHSRHDGPFHSLSETAAYFRREVGMTCAKGQGYWWFDMFGGWYDDPDMMEELKKLRDLTVHLQETSMEPASEVCLLTDLESNYFLGRQESADGSGKIEYPMAESQAPALNRMGLPWDSLLTDDLFSDAFDMDRYKLFYFPNLFHPSKALMQKIEQLRAAGKSLLFAHAPGYISETGFSLENMARLTGFKLERAEELCRTLTTQSGLTWDMPVSPRFFVQNPEETWAVYEDGTSALALQQRDHAFDAFCSGVPIPMEILRALAERAGCFRYIDTYDPVYLNNRFMTVFCHKPGNRVLRWPKPAKLHDYFTREIINIGPKGAVVVFKTNETRIFLVEPDT